MYIEKYKCLRTKKQKCSLPVTGKGLTNGRLLWLYGLKSWTRCNPVKAIRSRVPIATSIWIGKYLRHIEQQNVSKLIVDDFDKHVSVPLMVRHVYCSKQQLNPTKTVKAIRECSTHPLHTLEWLHKILQSRDIPEKQCSNRFFDCIYAFHYTNINSCVSWQKKQQKRHAPWQPNLDSADDH